mgnify:CR=1 FL=1
MTKKPVDAIELNSNLVYCGYVLSPFFEEVTLKAYNGGWDVITVPSEEVIYVFSNDNSFSPILTSPIFNDFTVKSVSELTTFEVPV